MLKHKSLFISALLVSASFCACSEAPVKTTPTPQVSAPASTSDTATPASLTIEDGGTGPYKAVVVGEATLPGFAIYRPKDLSAFGQEKKLPVVLWGNGGAANTSGQYTKYLTEVASQGFLVIAIGPYDVLVTPNPEVQRKGTNAKQFLEALDWITAQSKQPGSVYQGKVNVNKVAAMGHSLGGLQAIEASMDPRISTTVMCNTGIFKENSESANSSFAALVPNVKKSMLDQLHAPIIYLLGGKSDIAYENGMDDVARTTKVPLVMASQEVGHNATYDKPHGGSFAVATAAWLKWQLQGDAEAKKMFIDGAQSGLVKSDPQWTVQVKNQEKATSKGK